MTRIARHWTPWYLLLALSLGMLGPVPDTLATPVCLGAGLVCEDHYTESQTCEDGSTKDNVSCHKYGVCEATGDTGQCTPGAGSWCEDPCDGSDSAPASPEWTTPLVTSDGVTLLTDLYATTLEPQPVLLLRTPWVRSALSGHATSLMEANEAMVLVQSVRGRGGSGGSDQFFGTAAQDGYDTITAIEELGLSAGIIATRGANDLATVQRLMGPGAPEIYRCQYTESGFHDLPTGLAYRGGVRRTEVQGWLQDRELEFLVSQWAAHPDPTDSYWDSLRLSDEEIGQVRTTGLHRAGWYDVSLEDTVTYFRRLQFNGGDGAKNNQWLVIGPWDYEGRYEEQDFPGVLEGSPESALEAAWRLQCLYEVAGQLDALEPVHVYVMGAVGDGGAPGHEWRSYGTWPPPSDELALYLTPEGGLSLVEAVEGVASYQNDPENPVPTVGGRNLSVPSGPLDQSELEGRDDVLVYTSDLSAGLEFVGDARAMLWLNSPPGPSQVVVRLTDVHPDGRSLLIASGIQALEGQGGPVEVEVSLGPTAYHLAEGHQLRLSVSGSSADAFAVEPTLMSIDLTFGPVTRSRLVLPVVSGMQPDGPPSNPEEEPDAGGDETDTSVSPPAPEGDTRGNIKWDLGAGPPPQDDAIVNLDGDGGDAAVSVPRRDEGCGSAPATSVWALALLGLYGMRRRRGDEVG